MKQTEVCPNEARIEQLLRSLTTEAETLELTQHLDECAVCRKRAQTISENAALEDDLHWAVEARAQSPVRIDAPLHTLNEMLPDFEILGELGRGGMGVVYRARQRKLDRLIAVKVLPALLGTVRPDARERFRREAEMAASLDHTNIAGVHDFGEVNGTLFYVMQLIEGRSLRTVLNEIADAGTTDIVVGPEGSGSQAPSKTSVEGVSSRPVYFRKVAHWIAEVAEAMQYAHDKGIIHRDIKPSNLLLAENGRLVISDFGLARVSDAQSPIQTRGLIGTCRYMSPEQVESNLGPVDAQSDVYALGATLYELLTIKPLFSAADERELLRQVVEVDPAPPSRIVPQVPRELETICLKAITKEKRNRYTDAGKMAEDLHRWLLDLPIHARRQTVSERAWRFVRRRKVYVLLTLLTVGLAITAAGLWSTNSATQRKANEASQEAIRSQVALALSNARSALDAEDIDDALMHLRAGLAIVPDDLELNRLKARILYRTGKQNAAMETIRGIVSRHPQDWQSHFLAAFAMRPCLSGDWTCRCIDRKGLLGPNPSDTLTQRFETHLTAVQEWRAGEAEEFCLLSCQEPDPQMALTLLNAALTKDPEMSEALLLRALRYESLGNIEAMTLDAQRAVEIRKGSDLAYGILGTAYYLSDEYAKALTTLDEAIKRNARNVLWWYDRAVVHVYLGNFKDALADANTAIDINPNYAFAYVAKAKAFVGLGKRDEAMTNYNHAESLDPRIADIYIERCELFLRAAQFDEALADAERGIKLRPYHASGYQRMAQVYILTDQYDKAMVPVNKCLELNPQDAISLLLKGIVLSRASQFEEAIVVLNQAFEFAPDDFRILQYRAQSLTGLERYQEAISDLTRWVQLRRRDPIARFNRGVIYEVIGESRLALSDYDNAAKIYPALRDYADLWSFLLCRGDGEFDKANAYLSPHVVAAEPTTWTQRLFAFADGRISFFELTSAASSLTEQVEAYYYGGMMALLADDRAEAISRFRRSAELNTNEVLEGDVALIRLRMLGADRAKDTSEVSDDLP